MNGSPALIDTNILGYVFDSREPEKRQISRDLLTKCWKGEIQYAVSVQNLAEFAVIVTEKVTNPVPPDTVQTFIHTITAYDGWIKIGYSGKTIEEAIKIQSIHKIHFWDALIIATMKEHGLSQLYSEDRHFARVPSITVINPFRRVKSSGKKEHHI
jgi:predicted nucleic acid-binding protein